MLKIYKNMFLERIEKAGLDQTHFQSEEINQLRSEQLEPPARFSFISAFRSFLVEVFSMPFSPAWIPVFTISVKDAPISFSLRHTGDSFSKFRYRYTDFSPGYPETVWQDPVDIDVALRAFERWLKNVANKYIEENQAPDLWVHINSYRPLVDDSPVSEEDTTDFTEEEKVDARQSVERFRLLVIKNFEPTRDQAQFINSQLDYLAEAVDRLNRFDWKALAISALVSIAVNLSVDTEKGRLLFKLFQQAFQSALKLLQ